MYDKLSSIPIGISLVVWVEFESSSSDFSDSISLSDL